MTSQAYASEWKRQGDEPSTHPSALVMEPLWRTWRIRRETCSYSTVHRGRAPSRRYVQLMAPSNPQLLDFLSRILFVDSAGLAGILGELRTTVLRSLTGLLADGIVGRVSFGTALLPSSQRYYLTAGRNSETALPSHP